MTVHLTREAVAPTVNRAHLTHPKYRADIDGLRAIAVLLVVGFHSSPEWFLGGFVGVDIFFVISGFLISTIIFDSLERNSFNYVEFYVRRINRIFPALLLVMIVSLMFGWLILLMDEYRQLGKHVVGGSGFVSNNVLWGESGYFDNEARTKPLMHLWSLSIEEQFYILWPLLLGVCWKKRWSFLAITAVVAVISFAYNIYTTSEDMAAAFYSPVARFWELMIGGLLAYAKLHRPRLTDKHNNWQSILGFTLLLLSQILINKGELFPGWLVLLPTVAAFLIISAGTDAWLNKNILSCKLFVWFGLISFPLYLWSWSLLAFVQIVEGGMPPRNIRMASVFISIALAWLTYKFIEKPIRSCVFSNRKPIVLMIVMAGVFFAGFMVNKGVLKPRNNNSDDQKLVAAAGDWDYPGKLKEHRYLGETLYYVDGKNSDTTVLWGDSHVAQYGPRISELMQQTNKEFNTVYFSTFGGCPPIPNIFEIKDTLGMCDKSRVATLAFIKQRQVKVVVIGGCWNCYFLNQLEDTKQIMGDHDLFFLKNGEKEYFRKGHGKELALYELEALLKELSRDKKVYLLLDNPIGENFNAKNFITGERFVRMQAKPFSRNTEISPLQLQLRDELIKLAKRAGVEVIDPVDKLCDGKYCLRTNQNGKPIYKDGNHLRPFFIKHEADYIDKVLVTK